MDLAKWREELRRVRIAYCLNSRNKRTQAENTKSVLFDLVVSQPYERTEIKWRRGPAEKDIFMLLSEFIDDYHQLAFHRGVLEDPTEDDWKTLPRVFGAYLFEGAKLLDGVEKDGTYLCGIRRKIQIIQPSLKRFANDTQQSENDRSCQIRMPRIYQWNRRDLRVIACIL